MNSSVIVFPGSNCDRDIAVALKKDAVQNKIGMAQRDESS